MTDFQAIFQTNSLLNVFINLTQTRCLLLPPTERIVVSYCALMNHTSKLFKFFGYQFICILKPKELCVFQRSQRYPKGIFSLPSENFY